MESTPEAIARGETEVATSGPSSVEAGTSLAFLQRRVANWGMFGFAVGASFLALRVLIFLVSGNAEEIFRSHIAWHLVLSLCLLGMSLASRRARSRRVVRRVEAVALLGAAVATLLMGAGIPFISRPDLIMVLVLMAVLVGRSVYVPSTARHTAALGGMMGLPLVVAAYFYAVGADPELIALSPPGEDPSKEAFAAYIAIGSALWWASVVAIATATSKVIYGLRSSVSQARRLGQYQLEEKLAEGGMGVVYRARHALLKRPTAIKVLRPGINGDQSLSRFEREVQLTAKLTHPNTITIYDYGHTREGQFYYAMEFLEGADLSRVVAAGGPQPPGRVIAVLQQAAASLEEAHTAGLIHRDIKPQNIMLCRQGGRRDWVKVLDFGLVKETDADRDVALSRADTVVGTPQYMSPEALRAEPLDARSDLYCLGAVGYFLLTGTHLFKARTAAELASLHLTAPPEPPSERLGSPVPADLESLLLECLAKGADGRPPSAAALRERLGACGDAGTWGEAEADRWWRDHADVIERRADAAATPALLETAGLANAATRPAS